jgi:hypothetical protein
MFHKSPFTPYFKKSQIDLYIQELQKYADPIDLNPAQTI